MSVHLCHPTTSPYENYRGGTQSATRLRNAHNVRFWVKSRHVQPQKVMSALPPIADICSYGWNVHTKRPDFNIFAVKRRKTAHQRSRAYRRFAKRPQASSCVSLLVNETAACQPGNVGNIAGLLWYSGDCNSRTCDGDFVYHPCSEPCPYEPTHDHKKADTRERVRISYLQ